jgi:hypothetical protein
MNRQILLVVVAVAVFVGAIGVGIRVTGVSGASALDCSEETGTPTATPGALPEGLHRLANNGDGESLGGLSSPPPGRTASFKWARYWVEPNSSFSATSTGGTYTITVTEGALKGKFCAVSGPSPLAKFRRADGSSVDLTTNQIFKLRPGEVGEFRMVRIAFATGRGPTSFATAGVRITIGSGESPCPGLRCFTPPNIDLRSLIGRMG